MQRNTSAMSPEKLLVELLFRLSMKCRESVMRALEHTGSVAARTVEIRLPRSGVMQPGTDAVNAPAPIEDVVTPMWTLGNPDGSDFSTLMKTGKLATRFCCTVVIDEESSIMNRTSRLLLMFCSKKFCEVPVGTGLGVWILRSLQAHRATSPLKPTMNLPEVLFMARSLAVRLARYLNARESAMGG